MKKLLAPRSELFEALLAYRRVFWSAGLFSFFINLLYLVPSIYMLQVYDRVLASRSSMTLLMLTLIMLGLYVLMSLIEYVRSKLLVRVGNALDAKLSPRVFSAAFERNLVKVGGNPGQALGDLANVRQFLTGNGLFAFFDAPWAPIYLVVVFFLHPLLGLFSLIGAIILFGLAYVTETATRKPLAEANGAAIAASNCANSNLRNAEVIQAMGMLPHIRRRWARYQTDMLTLQSQASDRAGIINAGTKFCRMSLQSGILGLGALLAIDNTITPGAMIAASILMGRALAPVELAIGTWKQLISVRAAYQRLDDLLTAFPERLSGMSLPKPLGAISVENLLAGAPSGGPPILKGVNLSISAGEVVGVIGPSASGKSTLARLLVGIWPPQAGKVRLDGMDVYLWNKVELGPSIGYLPQDVELFDGTIAENIARFGEVDSQQVIAAAQKAGVHDMILRLPRGYDTSIGEAGGMLSGGQRQRVGLARSLYGDPSVVILDEPNSNLDDAGEAALVRAVLDLKQRGKTVILITHRTSVLAVVDKLLLMREGTPQLYGPRDEVLRALQQAQQQAQQQVQQSNPTPATI
ncbi:type I secretion system permease/ATPase [Denitratisoma oestradiolicum]|uniref:Alkaline protease secretion ATP-binding protein AprD n=1 Tax=Denitratisoma oestradiolicum TaxID=311182 RepID=A0A6S6XYK7_9PROT|nr:type I secretion system permease/ATPase [Denitratisoma oestradiolicum]TWO80672.1 type I secretion system permease/ATPase [Denitratisoma oestradiolicum]CAB1371076.1 Alkaline protease secretion ATP-binding protein AprD [Denitratisoma oestradiolicum]